MLTADELRSPPRPRTAMAPLSGETLTYLGCVVCLINFVSTYVMRDATMKAYYDKQPEVRAGGSHFHS